MEGSQPIQKNSTPSGTPASASSAPSHPTPDNSLRVSWRAKLRTWYRRNFIYFLILWFGCVILLVMLWPRIIYRIKSGHAGVLYKTFSGGTVTQEVRDEGLQIIAPWNSLSVYDVRLQQIEHSFSVISTDGLEVKVTLSIRYHPKVELLGLLHQKIGPEYVQKIVIPDVQSLVRTTFGQYTPEEIYTTKRSLIQEAFQKALGNLGDKYVEMDDLLIKTIVLPPGIQAAIEAKLVEQQRSLAMKFRIAREVDEAARKEIEARGEARFQEIVGQSLTSDLLKFRGISAMLRLAESNNAKIILTGGGRDGGFPLIMDTRSDPADAKRTRPQAFEFKATGDMGGLDLPTLEQSIPNTPPAETKVAPPATEPAAAVPKESEPEKTDPKETAPKEAESKKADQQDKETAPKGAEPAVSAP